MTRRRIHRGGFTLAETVLASSILAIGGVAALQAAGAAATAAQSAYQLATAQDLARDLLGEINERPAFGWSTEPVFNPNATSPAKVTNRSFWTDVHDFHGLTNTPPIDENGYRVSNADGYTRSVRIAWVNSDLSDAVGGTDFMRVTIAVSYNGKPLEELVAYRTRTGDGWVHE